MNSSSAAVHGIVVSTAIKARGTQPQHAEGIVLSTRLKPAEKSGLATNHAEGIVARTAV